MTARRRNFIAFLVLVTILMIPPVWGYADQAVDKDKTVTEVVARPNGGSMLPP